MLRKASRTDLESAIIDFVGLHTQDEVSGIVKRKDYHYKSVFERWIQAQQYKNKNTEERNKREFRRFFERLEIGRELAQTDIRLITASHIEQLMTVAIQTYDLSVRKALEDYRMFFESVYRQAVADVLIKPDKNPCLFVLQNRFLQFGRKESEIENDERIIDSDTMDLLDKAAQKDHEKKEDYMPPYAYELAALTGMRSGELGGLMWRNIDFENGVIHVVQSQKFDESTRTYYIDDTKNRKKRAFPITKDIRDVLTRIQKVQEKYGKTGDYVFSTKHGSSTNRQISDYLQNKRLQYKISQPVSIHAERRTLNSRMAAQGVSTAMRASLLGHTPRVNQRNYTYDMMSMAEKLEVVAKAGKR